MTLFGDDDDAGGLSHLTGGAAALAKAEADTAAGAAQQGAAAGPRPGSAGSDQAAAMDVDGGAPAPAAGGAEQPPAVGEGAQQDGADPLALLPPEMRQPPEGEGYPDVQASAAARVGCWRATGGGWVGLQRRQQDRNSSCILRGMDSTWLPSALHKPCPHAPLPQARIEHWLYLQRMRGRYMNEEIRKSRCEQLHLSCRTGVSRWRLANPRGL